MSPFSLLSDASDMSLISAFNLTKDALKPSTESSHLSILATKSLISLFILLMFTSMFISMSDNDLSLLSTSSNCTFNLLTASDASSSALTILSSLTFSNESNSLISFFSASCISSSNSLISSICFVNLSSLVFCIFSSCFCASFRLFVTSLLLFSILSRFFTCLSSLTFSTFLS